MNKYRVPKKMWRKWSTRARHVFNLTYKQMREQKLYIHPETHPLHKIEWATIRWNAAWVAANACDGFKTKVKCAQDIWQ